MDGIPVDGFPRIVRASTEDSILARWYYRVQYHRSNRTALDRPEPPQRIAKPVRGGTDPVLGRPVLPARHTPGTMVPPIDQRPARRLVTP
jgi:hypothetical protein